MCLVISVILGIFAFNFFAAGDYVMGSAVALVTIGTVTLMVRQIIRVRKERGGISAKECLSCK